ncbi:MAG TPA: SDR family oxidoreductase [Acidimicrobiales bacterium]|jgi:NAD(P)-dependent dehydrogenase (short-subunit alcohol dehydrogenase family)|nr:SDR family oxidoreductase [Acidimicrobiales bacterium]
MPVVVITGAGGIGLACARRLGAGHQLVLAEADPARLDVVVPTLKDEGYDVHGQPTDVTDPPSVEALTKRVADFGPIATLVHTAGLSPTMASGRRILDVNLRGTALLIDGFGALAVEGTVGVFIASMAGHLWPMDRDREAAVATADVADLIGATGLPEDVDPATAYGVSKRGVILRVTAAAPTWGRKGARIVSLSPGVIATGMGHQETAAEPTIAEMIRQSPVPRLGTPTEIAAAVAWLAGPDAAFVTGTDLLIDGGVVAASHGWSYSGDVPPTAGSGSC